MPPPCFLSGKIVVICDFVYPPNLLKNQISFSCLYITKGIALQHFSDDSVLRFSIIEDWKSSNIKSKTCYLSWLIHTGTKTSKSQGDEQCLGSSHKTPGVHIHKNIPVWFPNIPKLQIDLSCEWTVGCIKHFISLYNLPGHCQNSGAIFLLSLELHIKI